MRITMSMISKQYRSSLNESLSQLNDANNKSTTFRKFDKASEDPFSAAKAYQLRREGTQNETYQNNLEDISSQLATAQSAMMSIHNIVSEVSSGDVIQAITGTMSAEDRSIVAGKLREFQQAIIAPANTKFGDKYVFGGSDTTDPPFSVGASGNLLYRGIDVNTGKIEAGTTTSMNGALIQFGKDTGTTFNGKTIKIVAGAAGSDPVATITGTDEITISVDLDQVKTNQDLGNAIKGMTTANSAGFDFSQFSVTGDMNRPIEDGMTSTVSRDTVTQSELSDLSKEQSMVDLGMGLRLKADGSVDPQSVFDAAIPGISFMGFGTVDGTSTGVSNNLYTLAGQIADQLESPDFSIDNIKPYLDNFTKQGQNLMAKITESGTKSTFLASRKTNLEDMGDAIVEKDQNTEFLDPADAITNANMQQYAYDAALKVGTQIMTKTLLDFMS